MSRTTRSAGATWLLLALIVLARAAEAKPGTSRSSYGGSSSSFSSGSKASWGSGSNFGSGWLGSSKPSATAFKPVCIAYPPGTRAGAAHRVVHQHEHMVPKNTHDEPSAHSNSFPNDKIISKRITG